MGQQWSKESRILVTSRHGQFPFQTGMVTATLLRRGLRMADAVEVARGVRDRVDCDITTDELGRLIERVVEEKLGADVAQAVRAAGKSHTPMVRTTHGVFPFSKGTILKDLNTAGVALEEAVELVRQLEDKMRGSDAAVSEGFLHEVTEKLLVECQTEDVVRRYRLTNWV